MIIRDAISSDFEVISKIYEQVDALHRGEHPNMFREPSIIGRPTEYLQALLDGDNSKLVVAILNNEVVGFSESYIMEAPDFPVIQPRKWLLIDSIAVDENIHRSGAGQSMLNYLVDWSKSRNVFEIQLKVYSFNEGAIKFYEKNEFKELSKTLSLKLE